jgi:hypothetical protein
VTFVILTVSASTWDTLGGDDVEDGDAGEEEKEKKCTYQPLHFALSQQHLDE